MSFSINTNVASLQAQQYLRITSDFQQKTIGRVTSGLRIVSSGDDAAGLAIANGYRSNEAVLTQGVRNANDGLSQLQIIDGGLSNISELLDRARTLAAQSASGTFAGDRSVLNSEFQSVIAEVDRQAQAVGLNQNGSFAKNLSVFVGGGKGTSAAGIINNGSLAIDFSKSAVDTKSLGLGSYQTANATPYDLSPASTTSVSQIIGSGSQSTTFYFRGAGFTDAPGGTSPISITVDTRGVKDTTTLVAAINSAITTAANPNTATTQTTAFKNANITASIVTDGTGREQLAFSSSTAAFQVRGGDQVANALLGNFSSGATGAYSSQVTAGTWANVAANLTSNTVSINGGTGITLTGVDGSTTAMNLAATVTALNGGALSGNDIQAVAQGGKLAFYSVTGKDFTLSFNVNIGGYTNGTVYSSSAQGQLSGGAKISGQEVSTTGTDYSGSAYFFTPLTGNHTQTVTLNGIHADGTKAKLDIALSATNAGELGQAVDSINSAIKTNSTDPALQSIFAVKDGSGIRFVSTQDFSVSVGAQANSEGMYETVNGSHVVTTATVNAATYGSSGVSDISNQASAQSAVTTLAVAVSNLGNVQSVVGRGQNQFNFAVNLAQSQLSNMAAAESRIRDADLASEAANMTKAQILLQAGIAALAQANTAPQQVLSLLRG